MEEMLRKALKRKEELQLELAEIDQFLDTYARLSGYAADAGTTAARGPQEPSQRSSVDRPSRTLAFTPIRRRGAPENYADIAEQVLQKSGMPLTRYQLVQAIEREGASIPSTDKDRYIGTILWRHRDRFVNLPGFGYWLKDRPCGIARYRPGDMIGPISDEDGPDAAHEAR
jgi:hypothetical protein